MRLTFSDDGWLVEDDKQIFYNVYTIPCCQSFFHTPSSNGREKPTRSDDWAILNHPLHPLHTSPTNGVRGEECNAIALMNDCVGGNPSSYPLEISHENCDSGTMRLLPVLNVLFEVIIVKEPMGGTKRFSIIVNREYDFHTEEDNFDDDNFGDYDVSDVDDDDEYVKFDGQDDEGRIIHSRIDHEEFSDPQRRIRIRPRTYNRVRRVVRKPLTLRRLRGRAQSGRRGRKGR